MTATSTETKIFLDAEELIEKAVALLQIQLEKALDQGSEAAPSDVLGLIKESQAMAASITKFLISDWSNLPQHVQEEIESLRTDK